MLLFPKAVGEAVVAKVLEVVKEFVPFGGVIHEVGADAIGATARRRSPPTPG